jgi:hypothetical protein
VHSELLKVKERQKDRLRPIEQSLMGGLIQSQDYTYLFIEPSVTRTEFTLVILKFAKLDNCRLQLDEEMLRQAASSLAQTYSISD